MSDDSPNDSALTDEDISDELNDIGSSEFSCSNCQQAKRKCDKLIPICGRCESYELKCEYISKKNKFIKTREQKLPEIINLAKRRLRESITYKLINEEEDTTETDPDVILQRIIDNCITELPSEELLNSIALALSYHEMNRPIGEDSCYGYMDGSALIACGMLVECLVDDALSLLNDDDGVADYSDDQDETEKEPVED